MNAARSRWLKARRSCLGASDAAAILGVNPWRTPFSVYADKVDESEPEDDGEDDPRLKAGHLLEPVVCKWAAEEEEVKIANLGKHRILRHPKFEWMGATLDRVIVGERVYPDSGPTWSVLSGADRGVLEAKTTGQFNEGDWQTEPPLHYSVQVQHQLGVTGLRFGILAVLIGGQQIRTFRVMRDDELIARMIEVEAEFWQRVVDRNPPEVSGAASDIDAVRRLTRAVEPGKVIDLNDRAEEIDARLVALDAEAKDLEAEREALRNELRLAIGEAEVGLLTSGARWTYKTVARKEYVVQTSSSRQLRRLAPKGQA